MRLSTVLLAAALGVSALGSAARADNNTAQPDLAAIRTQQTELRAQLVAGDDLFADIGERERQDLLARQDQLLRLIEGRQSFDQLNDRDQLELFNTLEWINGALNEAQDQRMICTRETRVGSHRSVKVCKTAAQRKREREDSQDKLRRNFNGYLPPRT